MNGDTSSWDRGEDTILRYLLDRDDQAIRIEPSLGYVTSFNEGGPIIPLDYLSPTYCPFKWDFPILDFKILNNQQTPLFLTEVILDVEESRTDPAPLFAIKKDKQRRSAGDLVLMNEGSCDLADLTVSFHLIPGIVSTPTGFRSPFPHSIAVPLLHERLVVDVSSAFRKEGVDIDGLILLTNAKWDENGQNLLLPTRSAEEQISEAEWNEQWKKCVGQFQGDVGTLVGEINFVAVDDPGRRRCVEFCAPVYLANQNRSGIPKPPTFEYDCVFDVQSTNYQKRVQIAQTLQPSEAERFTIKVAVTQSSFYRFRATVRDVTGLTLHSQLIEMHCFVPRSRREIVVSKTSPKVTNALLEHSI